MPPSADARRPGGFKLAFAPLLLLALGLGLAETPAYGQPEQDRFAPSKIEFTEYATSDEAFQAAREHYDGLLLIYFYNSASPVSQATERDVFTDDSLSALVNRHFARYAVDAYSEAARQLLEDYSFQSGRNAPLQPGDPLLLFVYEGEEKQFNMKGRLKKSYPPEELAKLKAWIYVWHDVDTKLTTLPWREFSQWMSETFQAYQAEFQLMDAQFRNK